MVEQTTHGKCKTIRLHTIIQPSMHCFRLHSEKLSVEANTAADRIHRRHQAPPPVPSCCHDFDLPVYRSISFADPTAALATTANMDWKARQSAFPSANVACLPLADRSHRKTVVSNCLIIKNDGFTSCARLSRDQICSELLSLSA